MPGYVMHVAIAQEYMKKHKKIEEKESFIEGNIYPDSVKPKSESHYGKSPAYTSLYKFLENNKLDKESLLFLENIKNNILEYNKIKK